MYLEIESIEQAEAFIKNLKRSENWVSDEVLFDRLKKCEELIQKHGREDLLAFLGVNLCLYYIDHGEYGQAWEYTETARRYAEQFENYGKLLESISLQYRIQRFLGNLEMAQELINEQINIAYKFNDPHQLASSYHNQGALFHRQRLKSDAMEAFEKSIEYIIKSDETYYISYFHLGYGAVLLDFKEPEKAELHLKKGFNLAKKNNFLLPLALAYSNYGLLYQLQNKKTKCIHAFKACIELFHQLKNSNDEVTAKIMLAEAYLSFDKIPAAERLLKETIGYSEKNNLKYNLIGIYDILTNMSEKKGNYKESLQYLKKLIQAKEAYLNAESDKRIRNLEMIQKVNILKIEKQSAEQMANIKHDFLANMSHEIRTPINSILGICYLLEQQSINAIQEDYVHRLKRSGENLLGIVNDVLDISRIESGKMELVIKPFSPDALLKDIYQTLEPRAKSKGLDFSIKRKYPKGIQLNGDVVRLYQVLLNLVSNSIKFTQSGSVILVAESTVSGEDKIRIEFLIKDTGIGIAKSKTDSIFERYEQANASIQNTFGGTGLGLSISKKIVELMKGCIDVKSRLNKGTQFKISIPFDVVNNNSLHENTIPSLKPGILNEKTILIADDNEENRMVAKEILMSFNPSVSVLQASNGHEALSILENHPMIDILFIDLDMPILDGIETVRKIRMNHAYKHLKITGNTASLSSLSPEDIKKLGFDGFIYKPYEAFSLIQTIAKTLA